MNTRPSDIVRVYRSAAEAAARVGGEFKLDERRLEAIGLNQSQIDGIFAEIEHLEEMDAAQKLRFALLDAQTNGTARDA